MSYLGGPLDETNLSRITSEHATSEINHGHSFYIEGFETLAAAGVYRVKLVTAASTAWPNFTWEIESSGILTTYLYRDPTGGMGGGSGVTPLNANHNSGNTSAVVITAGVDAPTATGTTVSQKKVGGTGFKSVSGGSSVRSSKIILESNTVYLRHFLSDTADNIVSFRASWYEHANV